MRGHHGMTHGAYVVDPDGNGIEILYELSNPET
jgi:catechol-2,3-dioxygenase